MRSLVPRIGMVLAAVVALSGAVVAVQRTGDHSWPSHWDARILPYVHFVERERGLQYSHPVKVEFLSDAAFKKRVGGGDQKLSAADEAQLHQYEGIFRALGLIQGNFDLRKETQQLSEQGIIGEYLPERREMLIRGDHISLVMQPTIVHEMTHALQAQHYELEPHGLTSTEQSAYRSLVEADAMRVEDAYVKSLPQAQRDKIDEDRQQQADAADIKDVPPILTELFEFPYALGPTFVDALTHAGGEARVNRAFRDRPRSEQDIVEPSVYLSGRKPEHVDAPTLRAGETKAGNADDFGMVSLLLVLGERVPFADAWDALSAWRGDNSLTYKAGGKDCIRIQVATASDATAGRLADVSRTWAAGRPAAQVTVSGRDVELSSCDPGTSTSSTDAKRPRTFDVLTARAQLITLLLDEGIPVHVAECSLDSLLRAEDPAAFLDLMRTDDESDPRIPSFRADLTRSVRSCASRTTS